MLRPLIIKANTDLDTVASTVLDARFKGAQAEAAVDQLKAANPHLDPGRIAAGTVVLVPDLPGFKAAAASSVQSQPFADFSKLVSDALGEAAERMKAGNAQRSSERAEVAAAVKSAIFKRLTANDPDVLKQGEAALKAADQEAAEDRQAEETLAGMSKAAKSALEQLAKIVG